ncbi:hypothetical protein ACJJTC_012366 [Scirpophaga incertulas]
MEIVPVQEWSGEESLRKDILANPVNIAVIQHTVTPECDSDVECLDYLRRMRKNAIVGGFTDIPYSFMIGGNGKVYEGAGWQRIGAHTFGYNAKSIGIGFIGDFRDKLPTSKALQAAKDLLVYGVENKHLAEDYKLLGHRQLTNTISPGEELYTEIQGWPQWSESV